MVVIYTGVTVISNEIECIYASNGMRGEYSSSIFAAAVNLYRLINIQTRVVLLSKSSEVFRQLFYNKAVG